MNKFLIVGANSRLSEHFIAKYADLTIPIHHNQINNLDKYNFDYILNCAALTNIDYCESHPKETFKANYELPKKLKMYCDKNNKKLILISSNYAVDPINVYGKSKQKMEELADGKTLVIRTTFYNHDHFVIKNLLDNNNISAYTNSYFNPVSITRLTQEIYKNKDRNNILNIFSNECVNLFEFAQLAKTYANSLSQISVSNLTSSIRPLNACVKSDIEINLINDLKSYLKTLQNCSQVRTTLQG